MVATLPPTIITDCAALVAARVVASDQMRSEKAALAAAYMLAVVGVGFFPRDTSVTAGFWTALGEAAHIGTEVEL